MDKIDKFLKIDDLRLPDGFPVQRVDTPIIEELRAKREKRFVLGPIPLGWWKACHEADPNGLSLALGLLMESCCRIIDRQKWVVVSDVFGRQLGLSRNQHHRAVAGLEVAGLIEVKRKPNHAPRVRLVSWRGNG